MTDMLAPESFAEQVRNALNYLYDPEVLREHPFIELYVASRGRYPVRELRDRLIAAIDALKPAPEVPIHSRAWRIYQVLHFRYVQQMDQEQTAEQLGVGVRQLRRDQRAAVQALADRLYESVPETWRSSDARVPDDVNRSRMEQEIPWLRTSEATATCTLRDAIDAAIAVLTPLAASREVSLAPLRDEACSLVRVHMTALKQAIISTATYALSRVPGGSLAFAVRESEQQVVLTVAGNSVCTLLDSDDAAVASFGAARTILEMSGGDIKEAETAKLSRIEIKLPLADVVDVLLVDDNKDFADLVARYLANTRFRLQHIGVVDHLERGVVEQRPRLVVLDVMMPGMDGWEVLARLRHHPLTESLPIVVCSVLPERDLALVLGATCYLPKPVSRQDFLQTLERALYEAPSASH